MAAKRIATSDLNHENWDREDEPEEAGTFKRASDEILKKRIIKTARRRHIASASNTTEDESGNEKKNIFGNFTFAKTPANPSNTFTFLQKPDLNGTDKKTETKEEETKTTQDSNSDEYFAKLKGLNESVSKWIKQHVDENPFVNLKPIFGDYEKYFTEIESLKKPVVLSEEAKKELSNFAFTTVEKNDGGSEKGNFNFGAGSTETPKTPQFTFGVKPADGKSNSNSTPQGMKPDETKKEMFSFGNPTTSKPTFVGFGTNNTQTNTSTGFSFGNTTPFTFSNVAAPPTVEKPTGDTNEEEDEPPKVEVTPVVEDGHIYTIRCKVFVKKEGNFTDHGVGNLFLKPIPGKEKVQLIVRAETNLGNLLCNFILSESIPTQRMGKKDVMLVCLPTPDTKPPPTPILLRVKSEGEREELLKMLDKHKK